MRVAVRVPISPSPNYLNRTVLLANSWRSAAARDLDADREVFVSPDREAPPDTWRRAIEDLEIRWIDVDQAEFAAHGYAAATHERFTRPTDADAIVQLDADLIVLGDLAPAVRDSVDRSVVLGVTAYRSPFNLSSFPAAAELSRHDCWRELFTALDLGPPVFDRTHPAGFERDWDDDFSRCPVYFNYGVVLVPTPVAPSIGELLPREVARVDTHFHGPHRAQLALSSALLRSEIANQPAYVAHYADDAHDLRVLHYMNRSNFDKETDLDDPESLQRWSSNATDTLHRPLVEHIERLLARLKRCPWNR